LGTTLFLKQFEDTIEIGITGAKAPCEPAPTALRNPLAVCEHLELTDLARCNDSVNVQALLDEGRETRDLGFVVLSRRTVNDFDLHFAPPTISCSSLWLIRFVELWEL
jgi:hypothetical protein